MKKKGLIINYRFNNLFNFLSFWKREVFVSLSIESKTFEFTDRFIEETVFRERSRLQERQLDRPLLKRVESLQNGR